MTPLAAGYQHFADGAPFAEIALRHPAVREVYFPWVDEPSGRPKLGFEEEDDPDELAAALKRDLARLRNAGVGLDLLLNANCYGAEAMRPPLKNALKAYWKRWTRGDAGRKYAPWRRHSSRGRSRPLPRMSRFAPP